MKNPFRIIGIIGLLFLLVGAVMAYKAFAPSLVNGPLNSLFDGKKVSCSAMVDANIIFSGKFSIVNPTCNAVGSCIVSPTNTLSIIDWVSGVRKGTILMQYDGKTYTSKGVSESMLSTQHGTYGLSACIPKEATMVHIIVKDDNGGDVDDAQVPLQ